jgi:imidazolonepropionase-like amidohydrolase
MLVGSDAVYTAFGTNMQELSWFVKFGMSNEQALQSATVLPAEMLGMEKTLGAVAPGYTADIVAVEGDPLTDVQAVVNNVRWVMKEGAVVVDKTRAAATR